MQTVISNTNYSETVTLLKSKYSKLSGSGNFFAIVRTEYDDKGNVLHDFLDVINIGIMCGYEYVNTIVYPTFSRSDYTFSDNVKYVIWFCKNRNIMAFNKDTIREKHIWKDVEWGKRVKNYNPKGKDPGNVWIPTEDDSKAKITNHIILDDNGVISRLILMSECGEDYELIQNSETKIGFSKKLSVETNLTKKYDISSKVIFKTSETMYDVLDGSVKTVITSPPYWNLKDYFKEGQIGQESYDTYLERMNTVWDECFNKLSTDGSLWININIRVLNGKVIPIPRDFVNICKDIGFYYKGVLIWHKSSGIPTGDKNIVDRHEYVLIFSKSENFSVNKSVFNHFADYKNGDINGGAFWNINRKAGSVGKKYIHPAIYPNELVNRIIQVSTKPGDVVLDPFLGSGTSLISAFQNGRSFIGYEYNEGFKELMVSRFESEIPDCNVEFIK